MYVLSRKNKKIGILDTAYSSFCYLRMGYEGYISRTFHPDEQEHFALQKFTYIQDSGINGFPFLVHTLRSQSANMHGTETSKHYTVTKLE